MGEGTEAGDILNLSCEGALQIIWGSSSQERLHPEASASHSSSPGLFPHLLAISGSKCKKDSDAHLYSLPIAPGTRPASL